MPRRVYPEGHMRTEQAVQGSEHHRPAVRLVEVARRYGGRVSDRRARTQRKRPRRRHARTSRVVGRRLEEAGWNVRKLIAANRMVMLDAVQTLDKFMRQDTPSPIAFDEVVGTLVQQLSNGKRVWIYGEMVDVLAARGNLHGRAAARRDVEPARPARVLHAVLRLRLGPLRRSARRQGARRHLRGARLRPSQGRRHARRIPARSAGREGRRRQRPDLPRRPLAHLQSAKIHRMAH